MKIALNEYNGNPSSLTITEQLNQYYETHESKLDDELKITTNNLLNKENWNESEHKI